MLKKLLIILLTLSSIYSNTWSMGSNIVQDQDLFISLRGSNEEFELLESDKFCKDQLPNLNRYLKQLDSGNLAININNLLTQLPDKSYYEFVKYKLYNSNLKTNGKPLPFLIVYISRLVTFLSIWNINFNGRNIGCENLIKLLQEKDALKERESFIKIIESRKNRINTLKSLDPTCINDADELQKINMLEKLFIDVPETKEALFQAIYDHNLEEATKQFLKLQNLANLFSNYIQPNKANPIFYDQNYENPLHKAALVGDANIFKVIYRHKPNLIYELNKSGQTPVHIAAANGTQALEIIATLKKLISTEKNISQNFKSDICPICLIDIPSESEQIQACNICKNKYHGDCIQIWLVNEATCPTCRANHSFK